MFDRLERYCSAFGPSGCEDEIRRMIIEDIDGHCDYRTDRTGNLLCFKSGRKPRANRLLVSAHMDEVGLMIDYITPEGMLHFGTVGGIESKDLCGKYVVIGEKRIPGVIGSKAIHHQKPEERGICPPVEELYIDIGADSKQDAMRFVGIGDCAVFRPNYLESGAFVMSKALDDRFGCAALVDIIRGEIEYDTYFAFVICEEVGCRGAQTAAYSLNADYCIVCEATTAAEEGVTPEHLSPCSLNKGAVIAAVDGGTIYDRELFDIAVETAKAKKIPYQIKKIIAGGNDSRSYQQTATGAKVAAISSPSRYIHSPSGVCRKSDLIAVRDLIAAMIERSYD